jgi:hypothetical protein
MDLFSRRAVFLGLSLWLLFGILIATLVALIRHENSAFMGWVLRSIAGLLALLGSVYVLGSKKKPTSKEKAPEPFTSDATDWISSSATGPDGEPLSRDSANDILAMRPYGFPSEEEEPSR